MGFVKSAYNSRRINQEPIGGRGFYPLHKKVALAWAICAQTMVSVHELRWSVREAVQASYVLEWNVRERIVKIAAVNWAIRQAALKKGSIFWHVTGGFLRVFCLRWRKALDQHRFASRIKNGDNGDGRCPFKKTI